MHHAACQCNSSETQGLFQNQIKHSKIVALTFRNNLISQICRTYVCHCKYVERMRKEKGRIKKAVLKEGVIHILPHTCTTVDFLNSSFMLKWLCRQVQPYLPVTYLNFFINTYYWHNSHNIFLCDISNSF